MNADNIPDDESEESSDSLPTSRAKWSIRFSDTSDSPYATGYMPLTSVGEMLWRTPTGGSFTVYETNQIEPAKTSRHLASLVHRLRQESGQDWQITTKSAILLWTDYLPQEDAVPGKRVVNIPSDRTRRVIICTMVRNPVFDAWLEKTNSEAAVAAAAAANEPKRPPGRPPKPKPKPEVEPEKRPRGRPRKTQAPDGQLDLE